MARAGSNSLSLSLFPLAGQDRMPRCTARFFRASSCRVAFDDDGLWTIKALHFPRAAVQREQCSNREGSGGRRVLRLTSPINSSR